MAATRTANRASVSWFPQKFRIPFAERCAALFFSADANVVWDRGRKKTQEFGARLPCCVSRGVKLLYLMKVVATAVMSTEPAMYNQVCHHC